MAFQQANMQSLILMKIIVI